MVILGSIIGFFQATKYPLIFIGCFIEGTVVMMATGLLWHEGVVQFWPAYAALVLADFLSDLMWYFVGYFGARKGIDRWGHRFGLTPANMAKVERRFHKYHTQILYISKLSMGFGLAVATLTTAGMLRVPLPRYIFINLSGGLVWVLAMMCVGYYFGNILAYIPEQFQIAFTIAALVGAFFGLKYLSQRLATADW
jgi:membrane protein DedA with SNARE-associated domain